MSYLVKQDAYSRNRYQTLKALRRLYSNSKGTHLDDIVKNKIKGYYASTEISRETSESLMELTNMVSQKLKISTHVALNNTMNVLFDIGHSSIAERSDYNEKQKGEIIVRIILFLIGEENETLVKNLGKEWKTYLLKY